MDTDVRVERVKALARQAKVYIWSNDVGWHLERLSRSDFCQRCDGAKRFLWFRAKPSRVALAMDKKLSKPFSRE